MSGGFRFGGFINNPDDGQERIAGGPSPRFPSRPLRAKRAQADVTSTPLFGQERAQRERELEGAQLDLETPHRCPFCEGWAAVEAGTIVTDPTALEVERAWPDYTGAEVSMFIEGATDGLAGNRFRYDLHRQELTRAAEPAKPRVLYHSPGCHIPGPARERCRKCQEQGR